jgi:hypothetical protein
MYDTDNKENNDNLMNENGDYLASLKGIIPTISVMMILTVLLAFATKIIGMVVGF